MCIRDRKDGLPSNEIFSIREDRQGDLLIAARGGASRMHDGHFVNHCLLYTSILFVFGAEVFHDVAIRKQELSELH